MTEIIRVQPGGTAAEDVAKIIATAFHELEMSAWLVPSDEERRRVMPPYFALFTEHALAHGEVYATADMSAVAVWLPYETPPPEIPDMGPRLAAVAGPHAERFDALGEAMDKHHPTDPHHYLAFLAVLPERQCQGLGSKLLDHYHARLDAAGKPAYLEASSQRSRRLYLRHGYRDHGEPLNIPGGAPPMFPMWRPPAS
ncbi:N-acetyltransferase [Thermobispora bispora]|jgi:ribosomal protein S18 acetylase RimI-like enzyme|uniref:GCN5-related N-acetyltransferase n=1 Tax=Thermobispora bispora (strain ATCC 19993 / DSM 43833 / CBS 139.67 / JCM 10125 / KCTC 9307 / NBRC 14880 / R51) TaxID=469371 RepID=D6Y6C0_THEBD|nr:GNAT family N-acetyltransferase [Thermobispora bispora]ADG87492.1 GCN5-related N-acetyltransferase [Thermobispora bispora DSM 43833]MBO2472833.1 N-acetyltransferase [Actinomycetales bacterium]MBX6167433.1 GNAT family N-acetyltransferase [Thermobispora bispora]QSI47428.1 N-acetyltransferase [Thermobispora bispora]